MEDSQIVELYWQRNPIAVEETQRKYSAYCQSIAERILGNREDAEEAVNDTLAGAWLAIPPHRPAILRTFLGKITRQLALNQLRSRQTQKRGGGETLIILEELDDCVPSGFSIDQTLEAQEITRLLNRFLENLREDERRVFLRRYWYFDSIKDIAAHFGYSQSKVKMLLLRQRKRLRELLQKEGIIL